MSNALFDASHNGLNSKTFDEITMGVYSVKSLDNLDDGVFKDL